MNARTWGGGRARKSERRSGGGVGKGADIGGYGVGVVWVGGWVVRRGLHRNGGYCTLYKATAEATEQDLSITKSED